MTTRVIKSLLALCAMGIFLLLFFVAYLYAWVIPHLDDWRPRIEAYVSEKMGHTLQIEHIAANASGFIPSFDLKGIRLLDDQGQTTLALGRVQVSISPISLLSYQSNRLSIDAPILNITRDATNQITVAGFKIGRAGTSSKGLDWVLSQKEIVITGGTIHWTDAQPHLFNQSSPLPSAAFTHVELTLTNGILGHKLHVTATPPAVWGQSLEIVGSFTQPSLAAQAHQGQDQWKKWTGNFRANVQNIPSLAKQLSAELTLPTQTLTATGEQISLAQLPVLARLLGQSLPMSASQREALSGRIERVALKVQNIAAPFTHLQLTTELVTPDLAGHFDATWSAGMIDAKGLVSRLNLAALHRYLPESISQAAKQKLQTTVQKGIAKDIRFLVKGAAKDFPFSEPQTGTLQASGTISEGHFAFNSAPDLTLAKGHFDLNGMRLRFTDIQTVIASLITTGTVSVSDLRTPVVAIEASAKGEVARWLELANTPPFKNLSKDIFATSTGAGLVEAQVQLNLPIADMTQSKISGTAHFLGADLTLNAAIPPFKELKGRVQFGGTGRQSFQLQDIGAHWLGGEVQVSGDSQRITGHGSVSAEALTAWQKIPNIQGIAAYQFHLDLAGSEGFTIESTLRGMQIDLPAPLTKPANAIWPLRYSQAKTSPSQDRISLSLATVLNAEFVREPNANKSGQSIKVLRGHLAVGMDSSTVLPEQGVSAHIKLDEFDVDAWRQALTSSGDTRLFASYLPTQVGAEIGSLKMANRSFDQVVLGASKVESTWRVNADARDFSGYAEYRLPATSLEGQFYARLDRLTIPDVVSRSQIEKLLENAKPTALPAIDVVIDDFELLGKKIGRLEVAAVNQPAAGYLGSGSAQEWRMTKLNITNPDSALKASGVWTPSPNANTDTRRVDLQFNLDVTDSGAMLSRLGQPGTFKEGIGNLQGRVAWVGSPLALHYPTLTGQFKLNMGNGRFLKFDPGGSGRFLSVLSLQALPKLLTLNFENLFADGFAFDSVTGDAQVVEGTLSSDNLQMKSVLALVTMDGSVDLAKETQKLHVLVLPDINAGGASLLATVINPVVGAATYLAQLILQKPAVAAATQEFKIEGSWRAPKVIQIKKK